MSLVLIVLRVPHGEASFSLIWFAVLRIEKLHDVVV